MAENIQIIDLNVAKETVKKTVEAIVHEELSDILDEDTREFLVERLVQAIDTELETIRKRGGRG